MRRSYAVVPMLFFLTACTAGGERIKVLEAWARPAGERMNTAAYFLVDNPGEADRLLHADSAVAASTELHLSFLDDSGLMRMQEQESIDIPARSQVPFEPGGLHVMFVGLNDELVAGDEFQLRLEFERAGEVVIDVPVKTP